MCFGKGEFSVTITKEEVVAAVLPKQNHWLPLSNLDLLLPPLDVGVFFCYKKPEDYNHTFESMVRCLKNALAETLVSYYALAGEVVYNSLGEPEVLCNNRGVDFVEAVADVELLSLNLNNPDDSVEGKLVPRKKHGVLVVQATWMKCGGLVVACSFDHRIADAYSTNMFLVSWAEMAQPNKPMTQTTQPYFRRSILTPRCPLSINPSLHDMYIPISNLPPPPKLKSLAKRTKLESFSAFLWKMVAIATTSIEGSKKNVVKMGLVVDGRKRLSNNDENKEEIMSSYFGNVLSIPYIGKGLEELVEKPLCWVADRVHELLDIAVTKEHFLGLIDWVENQRPGAMMTKIYCSGQGEEGPSFVVSSGQRFPECKVDFGWGKPVFGSYHFPWGGDTGYVMPMPSPKRNGDWLLYMHLPKGYLNFMESRASHFFRLVSWDYLLS